MMSMVVHLDNMTRTTELLAMPNGTRLFPARSCCDLREQYPQMPSGKDYTVHKHYCTYSVEIDIPFLFLYRYLLD